MAGEAGDEILVENEPWTGLVVVRQHSRMAMREAGSYGLVQASEWHQDQHGPAVLTVWRGPDKPDEQIPRSDLEAEDCRTVLVDAQGFYTCRPIPPDALKEAVWLLGEPMIQEEANRRAAESYSYVHDGYEEEYGDGVMIIARFFGQIAVNGESTYSTSKRLKIPLSWVEVEEKGGKINDPDEQEVDLDYIAEIIVKDLEAQNPFLARRTVLDILMERTEAKSNYVSWYPSRGEVEVWVSKKALKINQKYQADEKHKQAERAERRRLEARAEHERKVKAGGYPKPKDWSPKGEHPSS